MWQQIANLPRGDCLMFKVKQTPKHQPLLGEETITFTDLGTLKSPAGRYWKVTCHSQCRLLQFSKCAFLNWPRRFSFSSLICTVSNLPWIHGPIQFFLTIIFPLQYITCICIFKSSKSTECLYYLIKVHFIMSYGFALSWPVLAQGQGEMGNSAFLLEQDRYRVWPSLTPEK